MKRWVGSGWLASAALACLCSLAWVGHAQDELGREVPIVDPTGTLVPRVRAALERAGRGEGSARLLFYGASHTASDQYTGFLRARLQARYGDGGAGMVMAAEPFPLYAHRDVTIEASPAWRGVFVRGSRRAATEYGRAGFAVETSARGRSRLHASRPARHVEVWALAQPGGGSLELRAGTESATLALDGDARELRRVALDVDAGVRDVALAADGSGPVRVFGVLLESARAGVVVEGFGVPGARARDQLPWDEAALAAQLALRPPDLVAIAYGTNESGEGRDLAETEREVEEVLARLHRGAPQAACLVIGPSDWPIVRAGGPRARPRTAQVDALYRRAALAAGCGFFDLLAFQGGPLGILRFEAHDPPWGVGDHVHMTDEAHARLAEVLERALRGTL